MKSKWCITDDDGNILYGGFDSEEDAIMARGEFENAGLIPEDNWIIEDLI